MNATIIDQDAAIQDGIVEICDDANGCGEAIDEFGRCNPYCYHMTGDI